MCLLLLHLDVVDGHIRTLSWVFIDRTGGLGPYDGNLCRGKPPDLHLFTHRRQTLLKALVTQAVIGVGRGLRHRGSTRLALGIKPVHLQDRLAVPFQKVQYPAAFLLSIGLQGAHRGPPLGLTPIPVQMGRIGSVTALAGLQTQRLCTKPLGLVPLPGSACRKIVTALTHPPPAGVIMSRLDYNRCSRAASGRAPSRLTLITRYDNIPR